MLYRLMRLMQPGSRSLVGRMHVALSQDQTPKVTLYQNLTDTKGFASCKIAATVRLHPLRTTKLAGGGILRCTTQIVDSNDTWILQDLTRMNKCNLAKIAHDLSR